MTGLAAVSRLEMDGNEERSRPKPILSSNPLSIMETYQLEVTIQSEEPLTDEEVQGLEAVVEHGSVISALRVKAPVASIVDAEVQDAGRMKTQIEDVTAKEAVYGEAANEEAEEGFEVEVSSGRQIVLAFERENEETARELLIEQQGNDLVVIAASEEGLDADAIITVHDTSTTVESNRGTPDGRTFNGTEPVG